MPPNPRVVTRHELDDPQQVCGCARACIALLMLVLSTCASLARVMDQDPCPNGVLEANIRVQDDELSILYPAPHGNNLVRTASLRNVALQQCVELRGSITLRGTMTGTEALDGLRHVSGSIHFDGVRGPKLSPFRALRASGDIYLNGSLEELGGFDDLEALENLVVTDSSLRRISGFGRLATLKTLEISGGETLDLGGMAALTTVGDPGLKLAPSFVVNGDRTVRFTGPPNLETLLGDAAFYNLPALQEFELRGLRRVAGTLAFSRAPALRAVHLESLAETGGSLSVEECSVEWVQAGLAGLRDVGGSLVVTGRMVVEEAPLKAWAEHIQVKGKVDICQAPRLVQGSLTCVAE